MQAAYLDPIFQLAVTGEVICKIDTAFKTFDTATAGAIVAASGYLNKISLLVVDTVFRISQSPVDER